jgi:Flp pilus assembly secretin CpaC
MASASPFTPVVLEGGRISMRVRPEVSELSSAGSFS